LTRKNNESFDAYASRLFYNKQEYGLDCETIATLLNNESDEPDRGESAYRKYYTAFNRGRDFERARNQNGIATRILSISDLHVPFQKPVETFHDYVGAIDILQINGDVCDYAAISRFPKVYRNSPMEEMIVARQYLIDLIEYIRPNRVVLTYGNHDIRFQSYLAKQLDTDILELMPATSLELICNDGFRHYDKRQRTKIWYEPLRDVFSDIQIEYAENWYCQIGQVIFCHPLAFKSGIMKTSQDALMYFRNEGLTFTGLVMSHTHRLGEYIVGNTIMYEQGACCHTDKMHYADGRLTMSQKEGFLFLCLDKDGNPMREQSKLISLN
jgi:hypothetical protein